MTSEGVGTALQKGLAFLRTAQAADGSFTSSSSSQLQPFVPEVPYHTTFVPALILSSLAAIPQAQPVRQPLADWLFTQRSEFWSFNYWAAASPERSEQPYPDDLDDTFCAAIALYLHNKDIVNALALGSLVKLLLATETTVGGPYRTWLVQDNAPKVWLDVDLAVNSNIAYFLQLAAQPLPNLTYLMEQAIASGTIRSPYYPTAMPLLYYMARAYRGPLEPRLCQLIKQQPLTNALDWALAISSLIQLGDVQDVPSMIDRLVADQRADGWWPAAAFCIDPARQGTAFYHGCKALTTAFALEALQAYQCAQQPGHSAAPVSAPAMPLVKQAKKELAGLDGELQQAAATMLDRLAAGDTITEIIGLPTICAASLADKPKPAKKVLNQLAIANVFGWLAYIIFDDFLDDEGDAKLLPVAMVALRRSLDAFRAILPDNPAFQATVQDTFDTIDSANAWEVHHCRWIVEGDTLAITELPDYGDLHRLAERSAGHCLTAMAVLAAAGVDADSPAAKQVQRGFAHYLIARQLLDDAHDWEADLRAGRVSYSVLLLVQELGITPGEYSLTALLPRLQHHFWHHTLNSLCNDTNGHLAKARKAFIKSDIIKPRSPLLRLVSNLEAIVARTRREQANAEQFLQAYKKPLG